MTSQPSKRPRAEERALKIVYFGLPLGALLLRADGHDVRAVVRQPGLGLRRLLRGGSVELREDVDAAWASRIEADLLVSWFWTRRLPRAVLDVAPAIGVHPSLLPRWRGPDPFFWAIASGDEVTGVTAHLLEEEYDTGAILGRRELRIEPSWDAWTLARKLDRPSLALLREVVGAYARGAPPSPAPQDERWVTHAPEPDDLEIRWSRPAADLERFVRAAAPYPGAFTEIGGATVVVTKARVAPAPRSLEPGEAVVRDGIAVVKALDQGLALLAGRAEDDDAPLDARAIAARVSSM